MRTVIIGARRARQGLGPFVARDLVRFGMTIVAISTTSEATAESAAGNIERLTGKKPIGFTDIKTMLRETRPDVAAILSPPEAHEAHLEAALAARCHVLCEKPLIWDCQPTAARVAKLAERFVGSGKLLAENCQWPEVLTAFAALHPTLAPRPHQLTLRLSPPEGGAAALRDCVSHLISLAQALNPDPSAQLTAAVIAGARHRGLDISFQFGTDSHSLAVTGCFVPSNAFPRPASLEIDGRIATRLVEPETYRMRLTDGERSVPLPDPLTRRLDRFVTRIAALERGAPPELDQSLIQRAQAIDSLMVTVGHQARAAGAW